MGYPGEIMASSTPFKMRIEDMDCASCAIKIETAIRRLPGISDLDVNAGSGMLTLMLDEDRTSRSEIVARVRRLGYTPAEHTEDLEAGHSHDADDGPWWRGTKAILAALSGVLFRRPTLRRMFIPSMGGCSSP